MAAIDRRRESPNANTTEQKYNQFLKLMCFFIFYQYTDDLA